jgi:hypothetical protein
MKRIEFVGVVGFKLYRLGILPTTSLIHVLYLPKGVCKHGEQLCMAEYSLHLGCHRHTVALEESPLHDSFSRKPPIGINGHAGNIFR